MDCDCAYKHRGDDKEDLLGMLLHKQELLSGYDFEQMIKEMPLRAAKYLAKLRGFRSPAEKYVLHLLQDAAQQPLKSDYMTTLKYLQAPDVEHHLHY